MDFAFNASALAAGAEIEFGDAVVTVPSLGSLMLAPNGGQGRAALSGYYSRELKIAQAEATVSGRRFVEKGVPRFATWTSVVMRDVHIFDKVSIGEMGTTLASVRGLDPDDDDHEFDLHIWYRQVTIGKRRIHIGIDEGLKRMKRYKELQDFLQRQRGAGGMLAKRHEPDQKTAQTAGEELSRAVSERRLVRIALVERIDGWETEALATIPVRGLGVFRFGELMLKPGQRRINLIRATFGDAGGKDEESPGESRHALMARNETDEAPELPESGEPPAPTGGSMILGSGEGNGTPIKP